MLCHVEIMRVSGSKTDDRKVLATYAIEADTLLAARSEGLRRFHAEHPGQDPNLVYGTSRAKQAG